MSSWAQESVSELEFNDENPVLLRAGREPRPLRRQRQTENADSSPLKRFGMTVYARCQFLARRLNLSRKKGTARSSVWLP